jgi:hypothetical protein
MLRVRESVSERILVTHGGALYDGVVAFIANLIVGGSVDE